MKIAPLESSRYPLFIRIKRRYPLGRLHWRECSQNSHPISSNCAPPISVISQWVFSCFSWKLHHWKAHVILYSTAQSDAIHEAVSVEESAVKKSHPISSNLPPICVISQWVFNCFPWKLHSWTAHIFLYWTAQSDIIHTITTSKLRGVLSKSHIRSSPIPFFPLSNLSELSIVLHEIAQLESSHFPLFNHTKQLSNRASLFLRSLWKSNILLISPEIPIRPPYPSTLDNNAFSCWYHQRGR